MGIERFFNSLAKNETIKENGIVTGLKDKIDANYVYIDFNSVIYNIITDIENELNYLLYDLILYIDKSTEKIDDKAKSIAEKWKYDISDLNSITLDSYKTYFNSALLDSAVMERIQNHIIHVITQLVIPDNIQLLYIAVDGVPQMSKIIEQKKRRYNGYVVSEIKNIIRKKYEDANNIPAKRLTFEKYKVPFDRSKIISWTDFMSSIITILTSDNFKNLIRSQVPKIKEIVISHQKVFGEGEKKIMEHIITHKYNGNYAIYSPDADVIILGIIAYNSLNNKSNVNIIRFNSLTEEYDSVNISALCTNIYDYVTTVGGLDKTIFNKINVTNDISFMFTLFGNDFVPKLESIDVRNHIETLILIYCDCVKYTDYLMYMEMGKYRVNYTVLYGLIDAIANKEKELLFDTFLSHKYKNYNYLKREFNVERLYPALVEYIEKANSIFDRIRNALDNGLDLTAEVANIISDYATDINFVKVFMSLEKYQRKKVESENEKIDDSTIISSFKEYLESLISKAKEKIAIGEYYKVGGKIRFQLFDDTVESKFHEANIIKNLAHPSMEITDFDKEIYSLDRKLGLYEIKLNAVNFDLGDVNLRVLRNGNYAINVGGMQKNVIGYYETFFDLKYVQKVIKTQKGNINVIDFVGIESLVDDYIKGLFWVFNWYFNMNGIEENLKFASTWFYPHHRVPLLDQVRYVLKGYGGSTKNFTRMRQFNEKMNTLYKEVTSDSVKRNKFMNTLEHYLYVTPVNKHSKVPEEYLNEIKNNNEFFPNLDNIVEQIWDGINTNQVIDCKRILYLNKCNLTGIKFISFNKYMSVMEKYRNESDVPTILPPVHLERRFNATGGGDVEFYNKSNLSYYKDYFKQLYLSTKTQEYKKYYKTLKNIIK